MKDHTRSSSRIQMEDFLTLLARPTKCVYISALRFLH